MFLNSYIFVDEEGGGTTVLYNVMLPVLAVMNSTGYRTSNSVPKTLYL
jgi:hypothetical protein